MNRVDLDRFGPSGGKVRCVLLCLALAVGLAVVPGAVAPDIASADIGGSHKVAMLGARSGLLGLLSPPIPGAPGVEFDSLSPADINSARLAASYDTLALLELCNVKPELRAEQLAAVVAWVKGGGKLLIHDSDRCTGSVDYSWLTYPFSADRPGAQGSRNGRMQIIADTPLGKNLPGSAEYVDAAAYSRDAQVGDAAVMTTQHPAWCATAVATNLNGKKGATIAYAYWGTGVMVYSGLDLDDLGNNKELNKLWALEIALPWDSDGGLPLPGLAAAPDCPQQVAMLGTDPALGLPLPNLDWLSSLLGGPLLLLILPLLCLLLAELRNRVVLWIHALGVLAATAFGLTERLLDRAVEALRKMGNEALRGLGYANQYNTGDPSSWVGWLVLGPEVAFWIEITLILGDLLIFGLRLAALLGIEAANVSLPIPIDLLGALVWALMLAMWASVGLDAAGTTAIGRPWANLAPRYRRGLVALSSCAVVLGAVAGASFYLWGQFQIEGTPAAILGDAFIWIFGLLLNGAVAVGSWSLVAGPAAVWATCLIAARWVAELLRLPLNIGVGLVDGVANALTRTYDLPAGFGKRVWNWWCEFVIAKRLHLKPLVFIERPIVGKGIEDARFPRAEAPISPAPTPPWGEERPGEPLALASQHGDQEAKQVESGGPESPTEPVAPELAGEEGREDLTLDEESAELSVDPDGYKPVDGNGHQEARLEELVVEIAN